MSTLGRLFRPPKLLCSLRANFQSLHSRLLLAPSSGGAQSAWEPAGGCSQGTWYLPSLHSLLCDVGRAQGFSSGWILLITVLSFPPGGRLGLTGNSRDCKPLLTSLMLPRPSKSSSRTHGVLSLTASPVYKNYSSEKLSKLPEVTQQRQLEILSPSGLRIKTLGVCFLSPHNLVTPLIGGLCLT